MRALVVLAHPDQGSFNHAVARRVIGRLKDDGHDVVFHDLYAEDFDPLVRTEDMQGAAPRTVAVYCDQLAAADALVLVHPSWWGQPPSIMKGWVDRVFRAGTAYRFVDQGNGVGVPQGQLRADRAVILNTANSAPEWGGADPLEEWWRNTVLGMCGVTHVTRRLFGPMITSSPQQREQWLQDAEDATSEALSSVQAVT